MDFPHIYNHVDEKWPAAHLWKDSRRDLLSKWNEAKQIAMLRCYFIRYYADIMVRTGYKLINQFNGFWDVPCNTLDGQLLPSMCLQPLGGIY